MRRVRLFVLSSAILSLLARLKRLFHRPAEPPRDPYADRLVRVPQQPRGRSGAVALEEPDDMR